MPGNSGESLILVPCLIKVLFLKNPLLPENSYNFGRSSAEFLSMALCQGVSILTPWRMISRDTVVKLLCPFTPRLLLELANTIVAIV